MVSGSEDTHVTRSHQLGPVAQDIGHEQFSEAVIGYSSYENAERFKKLVERPYFRINLLPDPVGTM